MEAGCSWISSSFKFHLFLKLDGEKKYFLSILKLLQRNSNGPVAMIAKTWLCRYDAVLYERNWFFVFEFDLFCILFFHSDASSVIKLFLNLEQKWATCSR